MLPRILTAAALTLGMTTAAQAATITVDGIGVDHNLFADSAFNLNFFGSNANALIGSDLSSGATLNAPDTFAVSFSDNTFENGIGYDLYIYEADAPEGFDVSLTFGGPSVAAAFVTSDAGINIWGIELDDFGVAAGTNVGGFFVTNTGGAPELLAAAAINGVVVPLPASSLLLLGGLGIFAAARRRR